MPDIHNGDLDIRAKKFDAFYHYEQMYDEEEKN